MSRMKKTIECAIMQIPTILWYQLKNVTVPLSQQCHHVQNHCNILIDTSTHNRVKKFSLKALLQQLIVIQVS
jgi:hypothetical protein